MSTYTTTIIQSGDFTIISNTPNLSTDEKNQILQEIAERLYHYFSND